MNLRLFTTPLLATGLLLSTLGCSKKDDAAPVGTGSYKLDGATRSCTTSASVSTVSGTNPTNLLTITLVTTPEPASGKESVTLYYVKLASQSVSDYQLTSGSYAVRGSSTAIQFSSAPSPTQSSGGGLAGAFAGTFTNVAINPGGSKITDGVFTDAHQ